MPITRLKLPFGKLPPQYNGNGGQQWRDYCAVTDVNSDKSAEVVLVDLVLTGLSEEDATKAADVNVPTEAEQRALGVDPDAKRGLQAAKVSAAELESRS